MMWENWNEEGTMTEDDDWYQDYIACLRAEEEREYYENPEMMK